MHRFLEMPEQIIADFADPIAKLPADQLPLLERKDCTAENVDSEEETALGDQMRRDRHIFNENIFNEKTEKQREEAHWSAAGSRPMSPIPLLAPPTPADADGPHPMHGGTMRTPSSSKRMRARSIASQDAGYSTPGSRQASPSYSTDMHFPVSGSTAASDAAVASMPSLPIQSLSATLLQKASAPPFSDVDSFLQSEHDVSSCRVPH